MEGLKLVFAAGALLLLAQPASAGAESDACRAARVDWAILNEGMPVYYTESGDLRPNWNGDAYAGERRYIDDGDRAPLIAKAEERVFRHCEDPENMRALARAYDGWIYGELCTAARIRLEAAERDSSRASRAQRERYAEAVRRDCARAAP